MTYAQIMQAIVDNIIANNPEYTYTLEDPYTARPRTIDDELWKLCWTLKNKDTKELWFITTSDVHIRDAIAISSRHGNSIRRIFQFTDHDFFNKIETFLHNNGIITDFNKLEL